MVGVRFLTQLINKYDDDDDDSVKLPGDTSV